jgi:transcriptional antiterminator NusG
METKWYTVKVQSSREKSISERIKSEMDRKGSESNVIVPTEKVYFAKNGKKVHKENVLYPGYVFVETASLGALQEALKFVQGSSILKSKTTGQPSFMKQSDIDKMMVDVSKPDVDIDIYHFVVSETVKVVGGPFDGFKGQVFEINKDKNKVTINVMIFGRATPVDLHLSQIEKILD